MWTYNNYQLCLYHHGILGQKWGKRNGPPYPLDAGDHSQSEKKAGWRKSLDKSEDDSYNKKEKRKLSDKQKKALIATAAVVGTALAAYGGYKLYQSGNLNRYVRIGSKRVSDQLYGDSSILGSVLESDSLESVLKNTNPLKGQKNCASCSIAAFLRLKGGYRNATAIGDGEKGLDLGSVVEKCFRNAKTLDGYATKFGRSRDDAAQMLLKHFGDNASGVAGIRWKNGMGHAFNWISKNGVVSFFDAQNGLDDKQVSKLFWKKIDSSGPLFLANLTNADIVDNALDGIISR